LGDQRRSKRGPVTTLVTQKNPTMPPGHRLLQQLAVTPAMTDWALGVLRDAVHYPSSAVRRAANCRPSAATIRTTRLHGHFGEKSRAPATRQHTYTCKHMMVYCLVAKAIQSPDSIFLEHGGVLRMSEALAAGLNRRKLYALRDAGAITQLSRGVYRLASLPVLEAPDLVSSGASSSNSHDRSRLVGAALDCREGPRRRSDERNAVALRRR
jgi:hypothetical protein